MHVPYFICMLAFVESKQYQWEVVRKEVESFTASFVTVGVAYQSGNWHLIFRSPAYDGRRCLFGSIAGCIASSSFAARSCYQSLQRRCHNASS